MKKNPMRTVKHLSLSGTNTIVFFTRHMRRSFQEYRKKKKKETKHRLYSDESWMICHRN